MKKGLLNFLSFVALLIIAFLIVIGNVLPIIGVEIGGVFVNVLETVKGILVLTVIGGIAYRFTKGKSKAVRIIYLIAVLVYIVGTVLMWIK